VNTSSVGERLADQRYVTLILRLLLDRETRLVRGEVCGIDDPEQQWVGFTGADSLAGAIETWLAVRYGHLP
jgi:hypothetical protein